MQTLFYDLQRKTMPFIFCKKKKKIINDIVKEQVFK